MSQIAAFNALRALQAKKEHVVGPSPPLELKIGGTPQPFYVPVTVANTPFALHDAKSTIDLNDDFKSRDVKVKTHSKSNVTPHCATPTLTPNICNLFKQASTCAASPIQQQSSTHAPSFAVLRGQKRKLLQDGSKQDAEGETKVRDQKDSGVNVSVAQFGVASKLFGIDAKKRRIAESFVPTSIIGANGTATQGFDSVVHSGGPGGDCISANTTNLPLVKIEPGYAGANLNLNVTHAATDMGASAEPAIVVKAEPISDEPRVKLECEIGELHIPFKNADDVTGGADGMDVATTGLVNTKNSNHKRKIKLTVRTGSVSSSSTATTPKRAKQAGKSKVKVKFGVGTVKTKKPTVKKTPKLSKCDKVAKTQTKAKANTKDKTEDKPPKDKSKVKSTGKAKSKTKLKATAPKESKTSNVVKVEPVDSNIAPSVLTGGDDALIDAEKAGSEALEGADVVHTEPVQLPVEIFTMSHSMKVFLDCSLLIVQCSLLIVPC